MKVSFLKKQEIDFFDPFYADTSGMTRALIKADHMVVLNEAVYCLTMDTSQTAGYYIWDSYRFMYANQWSMIREVFLREENYACIGFDIFSEKLNVCNDAIFQKHAADIQKVVTKFDQYMNSLDGTVLGRCII